MEKCKVKSSPWPNELPIGTIIVFDHQDERRKNWFYRDGHKDEEFLDNKKGLFVLWAHEYEKINPTIQNRMI